jgi:hypothetical protein
MSRFSVCRLSVQALISLTLSAASPVSAQPQGAAAWVELTGQGAEVRAVAAGDSCPRALVDGQARPMTPRVAAAPDFPMVCSLPLPKAARSLSVDGRPLAVPLPDVRRIVILGDTGCRVKDLTIQACNDPKAWPFATVARLAARKRPDLVIHVGDYYYRETACPTFVSGCADSPYGDHGATWAAEFFDPARPLLEAAPWVFARGNHEVCARGGRGWYRFLDAGPAPEGCPALSAPFTVRAGDLNLFVLDSGSADDRGVTAEGVAAIAGQLDRLGEALNRGQGWIVTHRPVWGLVPIARIGPVGPLQVGLNFTEQAAFKGRSLAGVQMVVSGHVHHFSAISFGAARPAQLIVGTGGDVGEAADTPRIYGGEARLDDMDAATFTFSRYGYYLMDRDGEDWVGAFHDAEDIVRARCRLHQRVLSCTAPKTAPPAG